MFPCIAWEGVLHTTRDRGHYRVVLHHDPAAPSFSWRDVTVEHGVPDAMGVMSWRGCGHTPPKNLLAVLVSELWDKQHVERYNERICEVIGNLQRAVEGGEA